MTGNGAFDFAAATASMVQIGTMLQLLGRRDETFGSLVQQSMDTIRRALDTFSPSGLAISFNGGKDACVVLFLLMVVLAERGELTALIGGGHQKSAIEVVYFEKQEFSAIMEFLETIKEKYGITLRRYHSSYKEGMQDLVSHGVKAVLMGQRYGDPWMEGMEDFAPSTPGWPPFTRVNPILRWKFGHVWKFLKGCGLPYCKLYDEGYTSLGEAHDTEPNPALRRFDGSYRAAWQLVDEDLERAYRRCRRASQQQQEHVGAAAAPADTSSLTSSSCSDSDVDGGADGNAGVGGLAKGSARLVDFDGIASDREDAPTTVAAAAPSTDVTDPAAAAAAGAEDRDPSMATRALAAVRRTLTGRGVPIAACAVALVLASMLKGAASRHASFRRR
ncbi:unnamed protein product [Phaeothamnion confervicola]